jgi:hypothetical protein
MFVLIISHTPVSSRLNALGFGTYAMISSYPYPPDFIDWLVNIVFARDRIDLSNRRHFVFSMKFG